MQPARIDDDDGIAVLDEEFRERRLAVLVVRRPAQQHGERAGRAGAIDVGAELHAVAHRHRDVFLDHRSRLAGCGLRRGLDGASPTDRVVPTASTKTLKTVKRNLDSRFTPTKFVVSGFSRTVTVRLKADTTDD